MATGPRGERRPADVIGCAVAVTRLSVGDTDERLARPSGKNRSGQAGARVDVVMAEMRREIANEAAGARRG